MITEFKLYESIDDIEIVIMNFNNIDYIKEYLKRGGDVNKMTNDGWNLLLIASNNASEEAIIFLLEQGADTNVKNTNGSTPLILVANTSSDSFNRSKIIISKLLEYDADIMLENDEGKNFVDFVLDSFRNELEKEELINIIKENYPLKWKEYKLHKKIDDYDI